MRFERRQSSSDRKIRLGNHPGAWRSEVPFRVFAMDSRSRSRSCAHRLTCKFIQAVTKLLSSGRIIATNGSSHDSSQLLRPTVALQPVCQRLTGSLSQRLFDLDSAPSVSKLRLHCDFTSPHQFELRSSLMA
jgi:hypothetical protein